MAAHLEKRLPKNFRPRCSVETRKLVWFIVNLPSDPRDRNYGFPLNDLRCTFGGDYIPEDEYFEKFPNGDGAGDSVGGAEHLMSLIEDEVAPVEEMIDGTGPGGVINYGIYEDELEDRGITNEQAAAAIAKLADGIGYEVGEDL